MLWKDRRRSANVEDRRGMSIAPGGVLLGGGGAVLVIILALLFGEDPQKLLRQLPLDTEVAQTGSTEAVAPPAEDEMAQFVSVVLAETEDVWNEEFRERSLEYREPRLVLFTGQVSSACGLASTAVGPFYCPGDEKVYIDLAFYDELRRRFQAPGDFAQAYVIAHEVGHHVQNLLGISEEFDRERRRLREEDANALSVRLELQADFLAGVWAHYADRMRILEAGDIEEALRAATAIGDDALQKQAQGHVVPDSFTHGTSEQRVRWFRKGFESGDMSQGDTFGATTL